MNLNLHLVSEVKKILEVVHPNKWDYEFDYKNIERMHTFYIHYPIFEITNSKHKIHTIRDFYARLGFDANMKLQTVNGTRATLTQAERQSKYPHSHLSGSSISESGGFFAGFCFGGGPINESIAELGMNFNPMSFEGFLYEFGAYLEWESLEGGPFQRISSIKRRNSLGDIGMGVKNDFFARFLGKYESIDFTIQSHPPRIKVDHLSDEMIEKVTDIVKVVNTDYLVCRDDNSGEFFKKGSARNYLDTKIWSNYHTREQFVFKGQLMFQKVLSVNEEQEQEEYAHPQILEYIGKRLERKLTLQAFDEGAKSERGTSGCIIGGVMVQDI